MADTVTELSSAKWNKDVVKAMFPGSAAANIDLYFDLINDAIDARLGPEPLNIPDGPTGDAARKQAKERLQLKLYAFATIAVENSRMECKAEDISSLNTYGIKDHIYVYRPFGIYDFDSTDPKKGRHIGNHGVGMGELYRGRGFFQLTGMYNYRKYGGMIGMAEALVIKPDLANQPEIAARLLAAYLLEHKQRILTALNQRDFQAARRAVNSGALKWETMQEAYETGEDLLTVTVTVATPSPSPSPMPISPQFRQN